MKKKLLFIVNPITGKFSVDRLRHACSVYLAKGRFEWEILSTQHAGHAKRLAEERSHEFDTIVAVGGDGTVNEVASGLIGKSTSIGIIPNGSGNGLARHLTYSMNLEKALGQIATGERKLVDILRVNGKPCFNVAGIGFDAHVAQLFQSSKKRGLISYMWISAKEFFKYNYPALHIITDNNVFKAESTFSLTIANASQLGNNAVVARYADLSDGLMDLCLIKKYPWWYLPIATIKLFTQSLHKSRYYSGGQSQKVSVEVSGMSNVMVQIDGESAKTENPVIFEIDPLILNVLMPIE